MFELDPTENAADQYLDADDADRVDEEQIRSFIACCAELDTHFLIELGDEPPSITVAVGPLPVQEIPDIDSHGNFYFRSLPTAWLAKYGFGQLFQQAINAMRTRSGEIEYACILDDEVSHKLLALADRSENGEVVFDDPKLVSTLHDYRKSIAEVLEAKQHFYIGGILEVSGYTNPIVH